MSQSEIIKKQTYLRENIIEKGYDPQNFVDFLLESKNSADINTWTLQELQKIVSQYIDLKAQQKQKSASNIKHTQIPLSNNQVEAIIRSIIQEQKNQKKLEEQEIKNIDKKQEGKKPPSILQKRVHYPNYELNDKPFQKKIQVIQYKKYFNVIKSPQVVVQKPEVITSGGFLGFGTTTKLWFTIKSNLFPITVRRTDQDFEWLRNSLIKFYPGYIIPPLKPCQQIFEDKKAINRRCFMINFFMDGLLKNEMLYNNKLVINFISLNDQKFAKLKEEISNTNFMNIFTNLTSQTGFVELDLTKQNQKKIKSLEQHVTESENLYKNIKQQIATLMKNFDEIAKNLFRISDKFGELQESFSVLSSAVPQFTNLQFDNILISLNNIFATWGKKNLSFRAQLEKHFSTFFNCCQEESESIKELLKRRSDSQQQYLKFRINLNKKKEKIYPQVNKWETPPSILAKIKEPYKLPKEEAMVYILPKLSDQEKKLRQWTSYLNKCCQNEFINTTKITAKRYKKSFPDFGKSLIESAKTQVQLIERLSVGFD